MSSRPSRESSPSNSPKPVRSQDTSVNPESSSQPPTSPDQRQHFAETPQSTTGSLSRSTPSLSGSTAPLIIITTGSPESLNIEEEPQAPESSRQGRSFVSRHHRAGHSSSQSPRRSTTPYARPRFQSQPRDTSRITTVPTMSSASSSPGNTSTSGPSGSTTSGSIPGYAPFPYPMPPRPQGGSGK